MMRMPSLCSCALVLIACSMVGCQQGQSEMAAKMKPERPAELDHLEMFVGEWEYTVEQRPAGSEEVKTASGVDTYRWACDRRVLPSA